MPERLSKASGPGLTPETYLAHSAALTEAATQIKQAASRNANLVKKAQNDGINPKHFKLLKMLQGLEKEELAALWRDLARFSAWEGKPIGDQIGMNFSDDSPAPTAAASAAFREAEVKQEGYEAGLHGVPVEDCPAAYVPGSAFYVVWTGGHKLGTDFLKGIGKDPKKTKVVAKGKKGRANPEDRASA